MCSERFPVERTDDLAVVVLPAEVDISTSDLLREELIAVLDQGVTVLIVDMSMTTFCDSAALSALITAHRHAGAATGQLRLVAVSAGVLRVMKLTGLDRLISLYPTLAAARVGGAEQVPGAAGE